MSILPVIAALALIWPFGHARKIEMTASSAVPGAHADIYISYDRNNNTVSDMKVHYLAHASALTPAEDCYVVWVQARGRSPENRGELTNTCMPNSRRRRRTSRSRFL